MHDQHAVCRFHGPAHGGEQAEAGAQVQGLLLGVGGQRRAVDEVQHQIRRALDDAAIDQARDVRMIELGQGFAFAPERLLAVFGMQADAQDLDRDRARRARRVGMGAIHHGHAAFADAALEHVGTDLFADPVGGVGEMGVGFDAGEMVVDAIQQMFGGDRAGLDQVADACPQRGVGTVRI